MNPTPAQNQMGLRLCLHQCGEVLKQSFSTFTGPRYKIHIEKKKNHDTALSKTIHKIWIYSRALQSYSSRAVFLNVFHLSVLQAHLLEMIR